MCVNFALCKKIYMYLLCEYVIVCVRVLWMSVCAMYMCYICVIVFPCIFEYIQGCVLCVYACIGVYVCVHVYNCVYVCVDA